MYANGTDLVKNIFLNHIFLSVKVQGGILWGKKSHQEKSKVGRKAAF